MLLWITGRTVVDAPARRPQIHRAGLRTGPLHRCDPFMPLRARPLALTIARSGLVTRAGLVAGGVHGGLGDRLTREGDWTRLAPSTWLTGSQLATDGQLVSAALEHAGPEAVITGGLACRGLDMTDVEDEHIVEVLVAAGTRLVSTPYIVVHQTTRLPDYWVRDGARHAEAPRAVVDAARRCGQLQGVRALVLGAVQRGTCNVQDLSREVEAGHSRGSAVVRRAVADAADGAWSAPEAEVADLVREAVQVRRLPPFLLNPQLHLDGRLVGRPDGYLPGTAVCWQVDSRRHHSSDEDFESTLQVHDRFAAAGLAVLHVTPRRVRAAGAAWIDQLLAAVHAFHGVPAGLRVTASAPLQTGAPRRRPPRQ